ncbi:hypothetical protein D1872_218040 [compost metagenome]
MQWGSQLMRCIGKKLILQAIQREQAMRQALHLIERFGIPMSQQERLGTDEDQDLIGNQALDLQPPHQICDGYYNRHHNAEHTGGHICNTLRSHDQPFGHGIHRIEHTYDGIH